VGAKRNRLMKEAKGEYIAYIDDDDKISTEYFPQVLAGCNKGVDCCSLIGTFYKDGFFSNTFEHSLRYTEWTDRDGLLVRPPNHLNTVKRDHALSIGFADLSYGEDRDYALRMLDAGILMREHRVTKPIYRYCYNSGKI
jgi:glycosyltransferase involved in cell wall biosynthesis